MPKTLVEEWFKNSHNVHKLTTIGSLDCKDSHLANSKAGKSVISKWLKRYANPSRF